MVKNRSFKFLSRRSDALALRIHHVVQEKEIQRSLLLVSVTLNNDGNLLACSDHRENLFIFDLANSLYWKLPSKAYYALSFGVNSNVLFTCRKELNTQIHSIDYLNGDIKTVLTGHQLRASKMTISTDNFRAITYCSCEAIIWELQQHTKLLLLNLNGSKIIHIKFSPVSNNIVACLNNHKIQIWNKTTFEHMERFHIQKLNDVTCFSFTLNERIMVTAGMSSKLKVISMDSWSIKEISLDNNINGIKNIAFLSYGFDGGANRFLLLVSVNCVVYYYDIEKMATLHVLQPENSSIKDIMTNINGKYLACILKSGEINLYKNSLILEFHSNFETFSHQNKSKINKIPIEKCSMEKSTHIKYNIDNETVNYIDKKRLKKNLFHFSEYPSKYRLIIWSSLLNIPYNRDAYINLINKPLHPLCSVIINRYDLQSIIFIKHLKRILSCLFYWCPDLFQFEYIIEFVFPFVKIFFNDPVQCFEIIVTILLNYCQSWFKLSPFIPFDILAIVENVLANNDKILLKHFIEYKITSEIYGWSLLKTGFSEVLSTSEWLMLWDHVVSNDNIFLLFSVVSYNIINRNPLLNITELQDFQFFFIKQNPINMKLLLNTTYKLLKSPSNVNECFIMNRFSSLPKGESYPQYIHHPISN